MSTCPLPPARPRSPGAYSCTRLSVRAARTGIEVAVVVAGGLLGGTVGIGTLLFAVALGPPA
ncbi:hypothetical protein ACFQZ2_18500, partial [Streptomonospora algeriensis]